MSEENFLFSGKSLCRDYKQVRKRGIISASSFAFVGLMILIPTVALLFRGGSTQIYRNEVSALRKDIEQTVNVNKYNDEAIARAVNNITKNINTIVGSLEKLNTRVNKLEEVISVFFVNFIQFTQRFSYLSKAITVFPERE